MYGFDLSEKDTQIKQLEQWEKFAASGSVADYLEYKRTCRDIDDGARGIGRKEETTLYAGEDGRNCAQRAKI